MIKLIEKTCTNCSNIVSYQHKHKPINCPHCGDKYWSKPKDERDLFILQDNYIENGRKKEDLGKMYEKLLKYSSNIIKHKLKSKKILSEEDFYDKSNQIALIMIERYLQDEKNLIDHSFGGMMMWVANGVLFGSRKDDQTTSLSAVLKDNKSEVLDSIYYLSGSTFNNSLNENDLISSNLVNEITNIIDMIYERTKKKKNSQSLYFLIGLNHFLEPKKESFIREFNTLIANKTKENLEKSALVIRNYLIEQR